MLLSASAHCSTTRFSALLSGTPSERRQEGRCTPTHVVSFPEYLTPLWFLFVAADGACDGPGVYTSTMFDHSLQYSHPASTWRKSALFTRFPPRYIALVEIAQRPGPIQQVYIEPNEAAVIVRLLFVLPSDGDEDDDDCASPPLVTGRVVLQVILLTRARTALALEHYD